MGRTTFSSRLDLEDEQRIGAAFVDCVRTIIGCFSLPRPSDSTHLTNFGVILDLFVGEASRCVSGFCLIETLSFSLMI